MIDSRLLSAAFLIALLAGCGGSGDAVRTVEVGGTVKLDSQPLADAEVNFVGEKYAGVAKTGPDGTYKLQAQPGENKVFVRKLPADYDPTDLGGDTPEGQAAVGQTLPAKFSDPDRSELKFTVPDGGANNADFQVTSK
jgi:hypothetical protein